MTTFSHYVSKSGNDILEVKTNQHVNIEILFKDGNPWAVYLDGAEFDTADDLLHGLFVGLGDEVVKISEIVNRAAVAYPSIIRELEAEERDNAAECRFLSSPSARGF